MSDRPCFVGLRQLLSARDPLAFGALADPDRFFWDRPQDGRGFVARGALHLLEIEDERRFDAGDIAARDLLGRIEVRGQLAGVEQDPRLTAGFAFARDDPGRRSLWRGFPAARIVLPRFVAARRGDGLAATWFRAVAPGESADAAHAALAAEVAAAEEALEWLAPVDVEVGRPRFRAEACAPPAEYCALVERALAALADGELEKVVLARAARLEAAEGFDALALLRQLRALHPSCTAFAVGRDDADFLGATPERLLRVEGNRVETWALAGSAARGRNPEEDRELARALLESKKEQAEHAIVVRALADALREVCDTLDVREAPRVLRLEGIQHLETPIVGTTAEPRGVLALAGRLHPTPAVAGSPQQPALDWIERNEGLERGWYAGAVGYLTPAGGGELAIALRSALLRGNEAHCFAGAGIVPSSHPGAELRETRLKLRTMLAPLMEL
jgi:isochorismate synthase